MAIIHKLSYNWNTNDSVAWTWTSTGTLTSQPTKWINWNYLFNSWNLHIVETDNWTNITVAVTINNNNTTDSDWKIFDARWTGAWILLASDAVSAKTMFWYSWNLASLTRITIWDDISKQLRLVWTYDWTTGIFYVNWVEKGRYSWTGHTNFTSIRIGQENGGSPNRRFIWDMDELIADRWVWNPAKVKNDYSFYKWYF